MDEKPIVFWKKSETECVPQTIPKDCLRLVFKLPAFDLQGMCLLGKTCKNFHVYFNDLFMQNNTTTEQDRQWMKSLIKRNPTQCTKMLIFYSHCHKSVKKLLKDQEGATGNYSYETWSEENRKKLFCLTQQKVHYQDILKYLYKHSEHQRDSLILAITDATSLTSSLIMKAYRGQWLNPIHKKKAFFEFLKQKEFDLMLETVRNNVSFFNDYYDGDCTADYVYEAGGFELLKKVVACGISLEKTHRLMCTASQKGDVELAKLLLKKGLKYQEAWDALNIFGEHKNQNIKQINKLLLTDYYTQDDKNKLLQEALSSGSTQEYRAIYLQEHGADITSVPLELLCNSGRYIDEIKARFKEDTTLASRLDANAQSKILSRILDSGNLELLEFICQQGFNLDATFWVGCREQTALFYAISNKMWNAAKILMRYGADINHENILNGFYDWCYFDEKGEKGAAEQFVLDNGFDVDGVIQKLTGTVMYAGLLRYLIAYKAEKEKTGTIKQNEIRNSNLDRADQKTSTYRSFFKPFYLSHPLVKGFVVSFSFTSIILIMAFINYTSST